MIFKKEIRHTHQHMLIPVTQLMLDCMNPRHMELNSQEAIINNLLENEDIVDIAQHIAIHGLSETNSLAVMYKENDAYTVLDGNRRVCALKLLNNPLLTRVKALQEKFNTISDHASYLIPNETSCILYDSRSDFNIWMDLHHSSNQKAAQKGWNPEQKGRFFSKSPDRLASQLLTYGRMKNLIDQRTVHITTTLTRYLSTPDVREALGIVDRNNLWVEYPEHVFQMIAKQFLQDAIKNKISSRIGNTSQIRKDYAITLKRLIEKGTRILKKAINLVPPGWKSGPEPSKKRKRKPVKTALVRQEWGYEYLLDNSVDRRLQTVIKEMHNISYKRHIFAVGCLLRMLIEVIIRRFLLRHGLQMTGTQKQLYLKAAELLEALTKDRSLCQPLRQAGSDTNLFLSPDVQSTWVHGTNSPTSADLESIWQRLEDCLSKMLELGKK